jgi:hypothetical protein
MTSKYSPITRARVRLFAALVGIGLLIITGYRVSAQSAYSVVGDFSTNGNPNGVWSYGWATGLGAPFQLLSNPFSAAPLPVSGWSNSLALPDWAGVVSDFSGTNVQSGTSFSEPDALTMDPQGQAVLVRFTAPINTPYHVAGFFRLQDDGTQAHAVSILVNGDTTNFYEYTGGGQPGEEYPFLFAQGLTQGQTGQTIDFIVSCDGVYYELSTGLQAFVAPCPYPATAVAIETNGFVIGADLADPGCGFTNAPLVSFQGGGGTGASAVAVVSNGILTGVTITSAGLGYTSTPAIIIGGPPSIMTQPQGVTVDAFGTASFAVSAIGTASMAYQWLFDGTNINGATSNPLSISNVVQTNLGLYSVVVSNVFGATTSSNALLSMYPYLESTFGGLITLWGQTNTLSVDAWGTGPLTYQWFDNGAAIANATSDALTLSDIQFTNAGLYSVVVTSALGSATSTPEQVVVNPAGVSFALYPGVTVTGVAGKSYIIQSTTNLSDTNAWMTVQNLTLTQPVQIWTDTQNPAVPGGPERFYRVLPNP